MPRFGAALLVVLASLALFLSPAVAAQSDFEWNKTSRSYAQSFVGKTLLAARANTNSLWSVYLAPDGNAYFEYPGGAKNQASYTITENRFCFFFQNQGKVSQACRVMQKLGRGYSWSASAEEPPSSHIMFAVSGRSRVVQTPTPLNVLTWRSKIIIGRTLKDKEIWFAQLKPGGDVDFAFAGGRDVSGDYVISNGAICFRLTGAPESCKIPRRTESQVEWVSRNDGSVYSEILYVMTPPLVPAAKRTEEFFPSDPAEEIPTPVESLEPSFLEKNHREIEAFRRNVLPYVLAGLGGLLGGLLSGSIFGTRGRWRLLLAIAAGVGALEFAISSGSLNAPTEQERLAMAAIFGIAGGTVLLSALALATGWRRYWSMVRTSLRRLTGGGAQAAFKEGTRRRRARMTRRSLRGSDTRRRSARLTGFDGRNVMFLCVLLAAIWLSVNLNIFVNDGAGCGLCRDVNDGAMGLLHDRMYEYRTDMTFRPSESFLRMEESDVSFLIILGGMILVVALAYIGINWRTVFSEPRKTVFVCFTVVTASLIASAGLGVAHNATLYADANRNNDLYTADEWDRKKSDFNRRKAESQANRMRAIRKENKFSNHDLKKFVSVGSAKSDTSYYDKQSSGDYLGSEYYNEYIPEKFVSRVGSGNITFYARNDLQVRSMKVRFKVVFKSRHYVQRGQPCDEHFKPRDFTDYSLYVTLEPGQSREVSIYPDTTSKSDYSSGCIDLLDASVSGRVPIDSSTVAISVQDIISDRYSEN